MKYLNVCLFIFCFNVIFAQNDEKENIDLFIERHRNLIETERQSEQLTIRTYDDLVCTFWSRELTLEELMNIKVFFTHWGYIFLPNNVVLIVTTWYTPETNMYGSEINMYGEVDIFKINEVCTYKIENGNIIINLGIQDDSMLIGYLDKCSLYFSFDGGEFEKYRLEAKFTNLTDGAHER